jgi:LDH2 family malate/lactate/ureidoglycolate dehydrogenase
MTHPQNSAAATAAARSPRYDLEAMARCVVPMFRATGMSQDKAQVVTDILLEADRMGHTTHGLALAPMYLDAATAGAMACEGEPELVSDRGACLTWRGRRLPGPWLTAKAVDLALARVKTYGTVTVAISDSHHIGALAAYLPRATAQGCMLMIACSLPSVKGVAPFGGSQAVFTPNPMAAGIPTDGDPILLDVSASITTLNMTKQLARAGRPFPQPWAIDAQGQPTTDPNVVLNQGGTLLSAGGLDHGHKGYAWALLVEALSQGISGFGRADAPTGTSVSVFIQVIDPEAFGGQAEFKRQMSWLGNACRRSPPLPGGEGVRLPGERALAQRREAARTGVALAPDVIAGLAPWACRFGIELPQPLAA